MLSDTKIKSLKPKEKLYRILDRERLYIEVRPSGKKIWRLKFVFEGKEGSISLGEYPAVSLSDARKLKDAAKEKLAKGINPVDQKRKDLQEKLNSKNNTFKAIAEEYIAEKLGNRSEKYVKNFKDSLERDVYKAIGKKDVSTITSADVLQILHNTIKRVRSQDNFGTGEVTASNNRIFIGAVMRYAIATLRAEYDPTYAVRGAIERPEVEHARPLEKFEAKQLRVKLDNYNGSSTVRNAGLAMLYSMLRTVEIRRMRWDYVDFEEKKITFPVSSNKVKKTTKKIQDRTTKKNRIHIVPMSTQLYGLLQEQLQISESQSYVFPAVYKNRSKTEMLSASTLNKMLEYIGLDDVTSHDFRATASTMLYEKGYESDWVELQLAHADENKTKATYNHAKYLEQRRKMLQDWADIVDSWGKDA